MFEGIRGNGYRGDIAIDDITYTVGSCVTLPRSAVPTAPPTTVRPTTSPTVPPKGALDCDFERGFCSWVQDSSDKFNWTRQRGATASRNTGPSADHTLKNGQLT